MNRTRMLSRLRDQHGPWDVLIIGGGATGIGAAVDAASRGYSTILVEQADFGKGTSSRSTKLAHGGVRYLRQGNVALVMEALKERALLRQNAPHLVHDLPFVVPNYDWWEAPFYGIGLRVYDALAGRQGFGRSRILSREQTIELIPTIETEGLRGGVIYYDGQFDDARLVINLAQTAVRQGAAVINYARVTSLTKTGGFVDGAVVLDVETGEDLRIPARVVVNATGVFCDSVRGLDDPELRPLLSPSQGAHLVLPKSFLPGDAAIMVPQTDDGRILFAIPWKDRVVIGTTDTAVEEPVLEPKAFDDEVEFLLSHSARYLTRRPTTADILSIFAGLRPLVRDEAGGSTAQLSRDHIVSVSPSRLVTIAGGKWTTYRKMAEDVIDEAIRVAGLKSSPSRTRSLRVIGHDVDAARFGELAVYGAEVPALRSLLKEDLRYAKPIHPSFPILAGEVVWAVRHEMARTVEDFLARRVRALFLDARVSVEMAPRVAGMMAEELGRDSIWTRQQVTDYRSLAARYLPL